MKLLEKTRKSFLRFVKREKNDFRNPIFFKYIEKSMKMQMQMLLAS